MKVSSVLAVILAAGVITGAASLVGCDGGKGNEHIGTWELRESVLGRHMIVTLNEDNTGVMITKINFRDAGTARNIRWARLGEMVLLYHLVDGNRTGVPFKYLKVEDGKLQWIDPKNPNFEPVVLKPGAKVTSAARVHASD